MSAMRAGSASLARQAWQLSGARMDQNAYSGRDWLLLPSGHFAALLLAYRATCCCPGTSLLFCWLAGTWCGESSIHYPTGSSSHHFYLTWHAAVDTSAHSRRKKNEFESSLGIFLYSPQAHLLKARVLAHSQGERERKSKSPSLKDKREIMGCVAKIMKKAARPLLS